MDPEHVWPVISQSLVRSWLMEKMGWEKGRTGLGANQDRMVDHIALKHKKNTGVLASKVMKTPGWLLRMTFRYFLSFVNLNKSFKLSFSECVGCS